MDHYLGTVIGSFVFYQDNNNWSNKSCELVRQNNHKKVKIPWAFNRSVRRYYCFLYGGVGGWGEGEEDSVAFIWSFSPPPPQAKLNLSLDKKLSKIWGGDIGLKGYNMNMLLCQKSPPGRLQLLVNRRNVFLLVLNDLLSQATSIFYMK